MWIVRVALFLLLHRRLRYRWNFLLNFSNAAPTLRLRKDAWPPPTRKSV